MFISIIIYLFVVMFIIIIIYLFVIMFISIIIYLFVIMFISISICLFVVMFISIIIYLFVVMFISIIIYLFVVMFISIITYLFVGGLMFYLRYLCLLAHSSVQCILRCVFVLLFFVLCTQCCQFLWIVYLWLPLRYSLTFICPVFCVPYVVSFYGLSICDCPCGIL
jgi:hypothetical protein